MKESTRPYEGVIMLHPDTAEEGQKDLFRRNKKIIEEHSGEVNSLHTWGKRSLGNAIGKNNRAVYFYTTFSANNKAIAELERTMRISDSVLRFFHMRLKDGTSLSKHVDAFHNTISESARRQKDMELKQQKRNEKSSFRNNRR